MLNKRFFSFLFICVILVGCSKENKSDTPPDDNGGNGGGDPALVNYNFTINCNIEINPEVTLRVYISDKDGNILAEGPINSNEQTQLSAMAPPNVLLDATFYYEVDIVSGGGITYSMVMFEDFPTGTYNYEYTDSQYPDTHKVLLSLKNIGPPPVSRHSHGDSHLFGGWISDNGGTMNFESESTFIDGFGGYYMSLIRQDETDEYYYWSETPPLTNPEELDFNSLPLLDNYITLTTPNEFESLNSLKIQGYHANNVSKRGNYIAVREIFDGLPPLTYGVPPGIFNRYRIEARYVSGNRWYRLVRQSNSIITSLPESDMKMDVSSHNLNSYNAQTQGDFDFFNASWSFVNGTSGLNYYVRVYGPKKENITFSKYNLINNISNGSFNLSDLEYESSWIADYDYINSYSNYLNETFSHSFSIPVIDNHYSFTLGNE